MALLLMSDMFLFIFMLETCVHFGYWNKQFFMIWQIFHILSQIQGLNHEEGTIWKSENIFFIPEYQNAHMQFQSKNDGEYVLTPKTKPY